MECVMVRPRWALACTAAFALALIFPTQARAQATITVSKITNSSAAVSVSGHSDFYYQVPGTTNCSLHSVYPLTGLNANTTYSYNIYNTTSQCSAGHLGTATFKTLLYGLSVTHDSYERVRLTLSDSSITLRQIRQVSPSTGACTPDLTVTGLQANTAYEYHAWQGPTLPGCQGNVIAAAYFTTLPQPTLSHSSVQTTTATLNISNWNLAWFVKSTESNAQCRAVAANSSTFGVSSLTGNTSYTYKAYKDTNCANEIASTTFLTRPAKGKILTVGSVANEGLQVKWQPVTSATSYKVQWKSGAQEYSSSRQAIVTSGDAHTIMGLTVNTEYSLRVAVTNATGEGPWSDEEMGTVTTVRAETVNTYEFSTNLLVWNHTTTFWFKHTLPAGGFTDCDHATYARALTGLTAGTTYTVHIYDKSGCNAADEIAQTTFSTANLWVGQITHKSALLNFSNWSGAWHYKREEEGATCQKRENFYWMPISGLEANTTYTYKAYVNDPSDGSVHECDFVIGTATFTTLSPTLSVSNQSTGGATISIGGVATGTQWWYKGSQGGASCTEAGTYKSTTSVNITGLAANTPYTYRVYDAADCPSANELASALVRTLPPKPAKPTATVGIGSGKLTLASSVTGSGALSKWQYKRKAGTSDYDDDWTDIASTSTSLSHTFTGLTDGTNYQYKLRAVNATGSGAESDASDAAAPLDETLSASDVTGTTATLTIGNWTGAWWYQGDQSGAICTSVNAGTSSASLTGLDYKTAYEYKAYDTSGCASANEIADASFTTLAQVSLTASAVTETSATLTISVNNDNDTLRQVLQVIGWYHKKTPSGSCTGPVRGFTTDLSMLTEGTSHTYDAYLSSSCTGDVLASGTFSTLSLTAGTVTQTTARLTLANHTGNWYHKESAPGAGACSSAVSGTTADLSNLTGGGSYTWKAYSDSTCSTEIGSASFNTVSLDASAITQTTATLTIGNWAAAWWYQGNQSGAICTSVGAGVATASLASLTKETEYVYKVYKAANCGAANEIGSETFTTLASPTLTVSDVGATTAKLTIGNHSGAWYYKYTTPGSGTCSSEVSAGTTTADATGLGADTSHVFAAYSDSSCSTVVATASAFTTLMAKVSGVSVAVAATDKLSVSWTAVTGATGYEVQWKSGAQEYASSRQSSATTATADISDLTKDTAYTIRVRATKTGNTGEWSDDATGTPTDATLTASDVEAATATLTIGNFAGDWYYKANAAPDASCSSSAVTDAEEDLTGLSSNSSYTYSAYSDSSCSTLLATATAFLTKPGKPTKPTAVAGAGHGKLTISASVTGSGTLTRWEYKQKEGAGGFDDDWTTISSTSTSLSHTVAGLTDGTDYQFKLRAVNSGGNGAESDASDTAKPVDDRGITLSATAATVVEGATADHSVKLRRSPPAP